MFFMSLLEMGARVFTKKYGSRSVVVVIAGTTLDARSVARCF
jgi:hypothetical protein